MRIIILACLLFLCPGEQMTLSANPTRDYGFLFKPFHMVQGSSAWDKKQGRGDDDDDDDDDNTNEIPLDGGLSFLAIAGAGLGIKKLRDSRAKNKNNNNQKK